uniref:Uncharacterized protein n=1 Tax=Oryza sativa subsp. japonica TaxID=39947 RepID=Q6EN49_ORYSJ|nr:hypothetical protein [Oryza sativa Japonica Group]BAD29686.1 hypothetical protein [Oryza sativa Japonica Group]
MDVRTTIIKHEPGGVSSLRVMIRALQFGLHDSIASKRMTFLVLHYKEEDKEASNLGLHSSTKNETGVSLADKL